MLAIFILAAILTPADAVSQLLMAGPLILLYGISIGVAFVFGKGKKEEANDLTPEDEA